jgi:hypothetical protein
MTSMRELRIITSVVVIDVGATGPTNNETPADGRGLKRLADHLCCMSRLMCHLCRDP